MHRQIQIFMIKGVITGDLVNSTNIALEWRQNVVDVLKTSITNFVSLTPIRMEMYRGDSFQIIVDKSEYALTVAVALRAKLRASTPENHEVWDARLSIGIGDISFESDSIVTSDGEAFRLSGRSFDSIGRKRLVVSTPWAEFNNAIELVTRFADDIISSWTVKQAMIVGNSLPYPKKQKDMAEEFGMTRQNLNYHWNSAKAQLILDYIEYFKTLMNHKQQ